MVRLHSPVSAALLMGALTLPNAGQVPALLSNPTTATDNLSQKTKGAGPQTW
jgi:hypothetical protein